VLLELTLDTRVALQALDLLPSAERQFGRYTLLCHLATGGMAKLYLARLVGSEGFEKLVAIKRIHSHLSESEEFIQMFVDEARLVSRIAHPHVVQVLELGHVDNTHFIAMEYVDGETLTALVRRIRVPMRVCARIIADAASGLHAAHELRGKDGELLGVVHRDVSPHNILISYEGAVKVVDFGVARAKGNLHTTNVGTVKGKFAYMAPEQARLETVDRRADLFALGIVLYEITTRHRLFKAETEAQTISKVLTQPIYRPSLVVPDYPPELERIVMKALERDPAARYHNAEELQSALLEYLASSGPPLLPSAIASLMREAFADRIKEKQDLLVRCEEVSEVLPQAALSSSPSLTLTMGGATISRLQKLEAEADAHRGRALLVLVAVAVLLVAAGAVAAVLLLRRGPVESAGGGSGTGTVVAGPAAVPVAKRRITILIKVTPVNASITLDGRPVTNPYEVKREAGEGKLQAMLSAPGHVSQRIEIPLGEGGSWVVALDRDGATPVEDPLPKVAVKKAKKTKKVRKGADDDELFGDPYKK
jgi:serine/threonine-protein kinase